jgi:Domain of unknown function (DUF4926)
LSGHTQESRQWSIRTVWIIDRGEDAPRLVTAYPGKEWPFEMIKEHDRIVLTEPVPAEGLEVGDVGTVVHVYADGKAFEVEFTTLDGKTAAVATVEATAARPVTGHEITHSRELTRASWFGPNQRINPPLPSGGGCETGRKAGFSVLRRCST